MTCVYKVSTLEKKSIIQEEIFKREEDGVVYEARMEHTWRWGYVIISGVEKDEIDPNNPHGLLVTDYSIEDQDMNDGVALWFNYSDNVTDEMKEQFEQAWEESGYEGVEDAGWSSWDMETTFIGPLEVELLEEVDDEEDSSDNGSESRTWPF